MNILRYLFILLGLCFKAFTSNAQKQPQVQEGGQRAPASIKIDGKLGEWPNPYVNVQKGTGYLSAFNSSSRIYYTIANDDKNLYLTVRGLGSGAAKKILAGGLVFTLCQPGEKKKQLKNPNNIAIQFPLPIDAKTTSFIMTAINQVPDFEEDSVAHRKSIDSLDAMADKLAADATKEIGIAGIKEIQDSTLSVYNTQGIKAAIRFMHVQPALEIAIPLKYLGLSADSPMAFNYNIRINPVPEASRFYVNDPDKQAIVTDPAILANSNNGYAWNATDFWGEYTLLKK